MICDKTSSSQQLCPSFGYSFPALNTAYPSFNPSFSKLCLVGEALANTYTYCHTHTMQLCSLQTAVLSNLFKNALITPRCSVSPVFFLSSFVVLFFVVVLCFFFYSSPSFTHFLEECKWRYGGGSSDGGNRQ